MTRRVKRDTSGYGRSGGKRAVRPHKYREEGGRRGAALEEARAHQRNIDAAWKESQRIIAGAQSRISELDNLQQPGHTVTPGWPTKQTYVKLIQIEEAAAKKREQWTLGQARSLVRQGYTVEHVIAFTGWARSWVEDADRIFD